MSTEQTTPAPVTRGEGQANQTPRSYPAPDRSSSEQRAILRELLDQAYREFLRDPRRKGPDHLVALDAWRRRRADAFAAVQKHFAQQKRICIACGTQFPDEPYAVCPSCNRVTAFYMDREE